MATETLTSESLRRDFNKEPESTSKSYVPIGDGLEKPVNDPPGIQGPDHVPLDKEKKEPIICDS
ncbi:uncharacterized protein N7518_005008 [Penicillium psychrosexuale]|uniref:uncharacterized protein n=1 Tax=Penicillium psychrosexuale TaxID=1002107 RepID=UPI002544D7E7|nr:uncharacterized protein N7518_005008 [Penicillium psychrosexuale]KAJ5796468.1 hypothetical protein N7518_005008 [Penicillium psychrosexuale]